MTEQSRKARFAETIQRLLAKVPAFVRLAAKIRNQAVCVLQYRLAESGQVSGNLEIELIRLVAPKATSFVDIGGNVGVWTAAFRKCMNRCDWGLCVEPISELALGLRDRFSELPEIEVLEALAGADDGTTVVFRENENSVLSSIVGGHGGEWVRSVEKPMISLDAELMRRGKSSVDVVKIDAEGFDFFVLRGMDGLLRSGNVGIVQFEYGPMWARAGSTISATIDYLEQRGMKVFVLSPYGIETFDLELFGEIFRYAVFIGVSPGWSQVLLPLMKTGARQVSES